MIWRWYYWLLLVLCLVFCSSCGSINPHKTPEKVSPVDKKVMADERVTRAPEIPTHQIPANRQSNKEESQSLPEISRGESTSPERFTRTDEVEDLSLSEDHDHPTSPEPGPMTDQNLLDSSLEFCQTSNDFWEQGDLENAIDALDKAYSLILKVNPDDDPKVLQQKEDLRFTISKRIIEVYASRFTVANGYHNAIPLVMNRHVKRALDLFKGREREFFIASYRRSGRYRPAIVMALKDAGLPEELSWLPLIESGFKVRALSRARALGLWQFIASTGYKYGLKRGRWIDERMDSEKSTRAAIDYLKELHQIFGDWTTVLAAYNCGEYAVLKRIRTQRISYLDNFWDLYRRLPRETAFYVPKFLAVLHILKDPQAHGFNLPPVDREIEVEKVTIDKQVHFKTIARRLDIDYEVISSLNPELRHNCTPDGPYSFRVPKGKGEILLAKLGDIPVWRPPVPPYFVHKVRNGESLSLIAQRYKTSVSAIMRMNRLRRRNFLRVGWRLKIPTRKRIASYTKGRLTSNLRPKGNFFEYVVRTGDSLWKIANRYKTTTKAIRSLNQLGSSTLRIGQVILISPGNVTSKPIKTKKYRVKEGDSPYLIAKRHQMNLVEFLRLNNLTPRTTIFPGQIVRIKAD